MRVTVLPKSNCEYPSLYCPPPLTRPHHYTHQPQGTRNSWILEEKNESACPFGWQSSGSACVRPFLIAKDKEGAQKECGLAGGRLVSPTDSLLIGDLVDLLQSLYDLGLAETTWLLGSEGEDFTEKEADLWRTSALRRDPTGEYRITAVPASAVYPFVCSLSHIARRRLLFQQQLIPKGAVHLSGNSPASIYFYPRQLTDFVALPCTAEGHPTPRITWHKNDVELVSATDSNSSFLLSGGTLLVPATPNLAYTKFHCTASNKLGSVRGASVLVRAAFVEAFATRRFDAFPLADGGARLECMAPAHQPS
ncbi:unnamed protein product, partial [Mesorhabditis belari]|uniref:Ig-like domain-containing protein n=1 Tax=Mesorhabditis belari TaxID=2138241 RepID=A0AAF3FMX9_9BILA